MELMPTHLRQVSPRSFDYYMDEIESVSEVLKKKGTQSDLDLMERYKKFAAFLFTGNEVYQGPFSQPLMLEQQVSFAQFKNLVQTRKWRVSEICEVLVDMENTNDWWSNKTKKTPKYKILARTLENWLRVRGERGFNEATTKAKSPKEVRQ